MVELISVDAFALNILNEIVEKCPPKLVSSIRKSEIKWDTESKKLHNGGPFEVIVSIKTIQWDIEKIKEIGFDILEVAAGILHEIGHILNSPGLDYKEVQEDDFEFFAAFLENSKSFSKKEELYSDYFVKICGFKDQMISGLLKLNMNTELTNERIRLMESNEVFINDKLSKLIN